MEKEEKISDVHAALMDSVLMEANVAARLQKGQIFQGTVVMVTRDAVLVDVGYKTEGRVPLSDFHGEVPAVGDQFKLAVVRIGRDDGELVLSKSQADWADKEGTLLETLEGDKIIHGKIVSLVKGGGKVDLSLGILAFLPLSKFDVHYVSNPEEYVGLESDFFIERYSNKDGRVNIVLSRKDILEQRQVVALEEFFAEHHEGDIVTGSPQSFTSFGAFIDLGGFTGLVHRTNLSWGTIESPKKYLEIGTPAQFKVIGMDSEAKKVALSLKHLSDNPWDKIESLYSVGDVVEGSVLRVADFGAFVGLSEGIEGLLHVSEMSWSHRVQNPHEIVSVGDLINVKILDIDKENSRISLGLKQVLDNPWDTIDERFPVNYRFQAPIVKVTSSGAFIALEPGVDGFLHNSDLEWGNKGAQVGNKYKEGDLVEVVVLSITINEKGMKSVNLGVKQLSENPWSVLLREHPEGSVVTGKIVNKTDFGIFVEVLTGVTGLIHLSNLLEKSSAEDGAGEGALDNYNLGDTVSALVLSVDPMKERLSLSIKGVEERESFKRYISTDSDAPVTAAMSDFLKKE